MTVVARFFIGGFLGGILLSVLSLLAGVNPIALCAGALALVSFSLTVTFIIITFIESPIALGGLDMFNILRSVLGGTIAIAISTFLYKASLKVASMLSVSFLWGGALTTIALLAYLGLGIVFIASFNHQRWRF